MATIAYAVGGAAAAAAAALGYYYCAASKTTFVRVGRVDEWGVGKMRECEVPTADGGRAQVLVIRESASRFRACGAMCTHASVRLVGGVLGCETSRLVCPSHGACFNTATGDIEDGPIFDKLPVFAAQVREGDVYVELPKGASASALREGIEPRACAAASASDLRHFVIIGAGPAGMAAAEGLRAQGFAGRVTLLNREAGAPYDRTKLSKSLAATEAEVELRSAAGLAAQGIALRGGVRVVAVDTAARRLTLEAAPGAPAETLEYTALLCASGGPARTFREDAREPGPPPIPNAHLPGIFPLRTLAHAQALEAAIAAAASAAAPTPIVVQGASFIGMETAAYLASVAECRDVTVVDMFAVPFARTLGERVGAFMQAWHESKGIKFVLGSVVKGFVAGGAGRVGGVVLSPFVPGPPPTTPPPTTTLPASIVVVGGGIVPAVEYLEKAQGVVLVRGPPGGVEVDEFQRTGDPFVYAAGDIAHIPLRHAALPGQKWRIEHWNVAIDQGRAAAHNMLAHHPLPAAAAAAAAPAPAQAAYASVPFFWTQMYARTLRCAGFCKAPERVLVQGAMHLNPAAQRGQQPGDSRFVAFYCVAGKVEAFMSFNEATPLAAAAQELIRLDRMPRASEVVEGGEVMDLVGLLAQVRAGGGSAGAASSGSAKSARRGSQ